MSSFASTLMDMGFSQDKAERALEVTGNQGVEPALEWLLAHGDALNASSSAMPAAQPVPVDDAPPTAAGSSQPASGETAKSFKCEECSKLFKSQLEIEYHATKSGHSQFSESTEEKKPLTDEEKQKQLQLLEQKLKEKKKEREEKETSEALEREKNRIRSGKEIIATRKKLEDEELKKAIEVRKREKEEDKLARQRVIAQIEADKLARKAKAKGGAPEGNAAPSTPPSTDSAPVSKTPSKDYSQTKLQIRLTDGTSLVQSFGVKEQLAAVRLYVEMNRKDGQHPFMMMTSFPRKVFGEEDLEKPLDVLGLVPSAVLILTKAPL